MSMTDSREPTGYKGFTGRQTLGLLLLAAVLDTLACLALTGHPRVVGTILLAAALIYFIGHALVVWSIRGTDEHCRRALHDAAPGAGRAAS